MGKVLKYFIYSIIIVAMISCRTDIPSLNGEWLYFADSSSEQNANVLPGDIEWKRMSIPNSWHTADTTLLDYQGIVWFKKYIELENIDTNKRYIIKFNAVDYYSKLYVNNRLVGSHEGGYTPFNFDVSNFVKEGTNEILMRVNDPVADETGTDGMSYWHVPHGKQNWYVQNSGIWQNVELVVKEQNYIENVLITPSNSGHFKAKIILDTLNTQNQPSLLCFNVYDSHGDIVYTNERIESLSDELTVNGLVDNPVLWDTENPQLYKYELIYGSNIYTGRFGFREFVVKDGEFLLNGKPFYMLGALDQDFYPESNYITPSKEYLIDEMKKAKEMGLNTLRCHIKIPNKDYLDVADELGLLVWLELPNWDLFNESVKQRYRSTFHEVMDRDWNHPSFVIWGIINESWGIDLSKEDQRKWLLEEFEYTKNYAEGRVIIDNSACWGNFHLKTEINDYHTYYSIPENRHKFDNTIKEVAGRSDKLFSKYGDSYQTGKEVLMISEFGNWGLPVLPEDKPMWFNRMFLDDWITLPEGVEKRFSDFKYDRIFDSFNELAIYSQMNQFNSLKYEIERIRLADEIKGYIITEFTDINWECNGLLDMWRNPKIYHNKLSMIQNPDIIIPIVENYNYWTNEAIEIKVYFSHYGNNTLSNLKLEWFLDSNKSGQQRVSCSMDQNLDLVHTLKLESPKFSSPKKIKIDFKLSGINDELIAKNYLEIFIYPQIVHKKSEIHLTNSLDEISITTLKEGGNVICFIDSASIVPNDFPFKITSRNADWYDGNWATNLNWVTDTKPFKEMRLNKILGFEIDNVIPNYIITDIPNDNFDDVLSGMFVAWLYLNSGYIVQMNAGEGKLLLVTFDMYKNYESDPFSATLLNELIEYLQSDLCKPKLHWEL